MSDAMRYYTSRATGAGRARWKKNPLIFLKMVLSAVFGNSLIKVSSSSTSRPNGACGTSFCCPSSAASTKSRHHSPPFHFLSRRDLQRRGNDVRAGMELFCICMSGIDSTSAI